MSFFKYLFIFLLFSIVGWILELIYRSYITKKIVNPGFMSGCVVPLYGFGATILNILCILFDKLEFKLLIIFIFSIIALTLLEFISGVLMNKLFHLKLWDYSRYKINYKGIICLKFSMIWGVASILFYYLAFPWLNDISNSFINNNVCLFILGIIFGIFLIDLCVSIQLLNKLTKYSIIIKDTVDFEKLKVDIRNKITGNKFMKAVYPYIYTNRFLRDKISNKK